MGNQPVPQHTGSHCGQRQSEPDHHEDPRDEHQLLIPGGEAREQQDGKSSCVSIEEG